MTAKRFTSHQAGIASASIGMLLVSVDSYIVRAAEVDGWVVSGSLGDGYDSGDLLALVAIIAFAANLNLWRRFPG